MLNIFLENENGLGDCTSTLNPTIVLNVQMINFIQQRRGRMLMSPDYIIFLIWTAFTIAKGSATWTSFTLAPTLGLDTPHIIAWAPGSLDTTIVT